MQAQYRFDNWTTDNRLPQNSINAVIQTRDNYIWLATQDGLVRFDGVRFTVFNRGNSPGISSNRFLNLYEDAGGDLWASTEQSGVVRLHNGQFTSYGLEEGLPALRVEYLSGDADGNVIVYPLEMNQAMRWSGEKFIRYEQPPLPAPTNKTQTNQKVICIRNQHRTEFNCYTNQGVEKITLPNDFLYTNLDPSNGSVRDADGTIWTPADDKGFVKIENGKLTPVSPDPNELPKRAVRIVIGERFSLLSRDADNALWLTDPATMQSNLLMRNAPPHFLDWVQMTASYEDREGNIWFGTLRNGLFRAKKQFIISYSKLDGLAENNVYPIFEDRNKIVWIGTTDGLFKYENGTFSKVKKNFNGVVDQDLNGVTAIGEDAAGGLLFAREGIRTVRGGEEVQLFDLRPQMTGIFAIHVAPDGAVWFGGQGGIARVAGGEKTFYTAADGLAGNYVKVIIDDGDGGLWIGGYGGLTHFKDSKLINWTEKINLPRQDIRALYRDESGVLWIGTYDGGLGRLADGKFTVYNMKNGLFNDGVFQILGDARRNFWISSNRGIYRVSRDELNEYADGKRNTITSVAYGKSDGMLNAECNGGRSPAGIRAADGRFWFPTQDGVAVVDPEKVYVNQKPPPMAIESLKIDNQTIAAKSLLDALENPSAAIQINADRDNFEIEYTALSFINSENLRFRYRLEGLDDDWIEAGTRRTAYYSFVPPGEYTFRVIAANNDGVWNAQGKSLRISVLPPFYKTYWFLTLAVLSFIGLAYLGFKIRLNQVEKARRAQEEFSRKLLASQEQERQRIAAAMHDSLGQSLLIIKNRIALAQTDIDEKETVEDQLAELSDSASSAIEECREIAYNLRPFQISRFGLSKTLYGMFMRLNEVTDINATAEIENIDNLLTDDAQTNIFRIVQESVNNIIKHSHASEALLAVKQNDGGITLLIEDNGRGFELNENPAIANKNGGFGLMGIAERVKMLDGSYEIDSSVGKGTSLRIKLSNIKTNVN